MRRRRRRSRRFAAALGLLLAGAGMFAPPSLHAAPHGGAVAEDGTAPASSTKPRTTAAPALELSRTEVRRLQRALKVAADGVIGARTTRALRRAEKRLGLPADGVPDAQVLDALKVRYRRPAAQDEQAQTRSLAPAAAASAAVQAARSQLGKPYGTGGSGPDAFDCSGLTQWAYAQAGVELPHSSFAQYELGEAVGREAIAPGDLVFFDSAGDGASDVGIATSASTVVSATTKGVREHPIFDAYWSAHYVGARRLTVSG